MADCSFEKILIFVKARRTCLFPTPDRLKTMRRTCLNTSLLALATVSMVGCHQAPGPTGGTALTPVSPMTAPGSTAPRLGPFNSSTRVAPPGTGSYGTANNYLGGVAPVGASSSVPGSTQMARGSTDQSPMMSRLNGMRVNDLTQAPPPPGYQPVRSQGPPMVAAQGQNVGVGQAATQPPRQIPAQNVGAPQQVVSPVQHESDSNTSSLQPLQSAPSLQEVPNSVPSTEPRTTTERSAGQSNLNWRTPSPRY